MWFALLACATPPAAKPADSGDTARPDDSARPDSSPPETGDTGDNAPAETGDTGDTSDTGDTEPPRTDWTIDERATGYLLGTAEGMRLGEPGHLALLPDLGGDGLPELAAGGGAPHAAGDTWLVEGAVAAWSAGGIDAHGFAHLSGEADLYGSYYQPTWLSGSTGDLDGDGLDDLPVGASYDHVSYTTYTYGSAYVLRGGALAGEHPMSTADYRLGTDDDSREEPQRIVLVDIDGDGLADAVLGAPSSYAPTYNGAGALLVFLAPTLAEGTTPLAAADDLVEGADPAGGLGEQLAAADLDADGYDDVLATARWLDTELTTTGGVYALPGGGTRASGSVDDVATLRVSGDVDYLELGTDPVPRPGDVDGSGTLDLALGNVATGEAWLFLDPGFAGQITLADADHSLVGDAAAFARGLALDSDLDGDGDDDLAIGIAAEGSPGSVAIFRYSTAWTPVLTSAEADARIAGTEAGSELGASLAGGHDLDGDGREDLAVGAPGDSRAASEAGAIWIIPGW